MYMVEYVYIQSIFSTYSVYIHSLVYIHQLMHVEGTFTRLYYCSCSYYYRQARIACDCNELRSTGSTSLACQMRRIDKAMIVSEMLLEHDRDRYATGPRLCMSHLYLFVLTLIHLYLY
jgi:hypothetical protein